MIERAQVPRQDEIIFLRLPEFPDRYGPWLRDHGTAEQEQIFRRRLQELRAMGPQSIRLLEERAAFTWHGWDWLRQGKQRWR